MNAPAPKDELDNLASAAAASMTPPPLGEGPTDLDVAAAAGQGPAPAISNADAIKGALHAAREVFCMFTKLESPRATLGDESIDQLGKLWGAVCDKRQINLAGYLGDYAAEIAAAVASISIAATVRAGVIAELAARKTKEPADQPEGAAAAPDSLDASRAE